MSEAARTRFAALWTTQQQLEILALCGLDHAVSFIANTAELAPETSAARFD